MSKFLFLLPLPMTLAALSGCSQKAAYDRSAEPASSDNMTDTGGIAVTVAPGVAFTYRYAFSVPPARIAAAQEAHAQACEKLGIARCRITGMRYHLVGENNIEAMLAFKLDPALARDFGKNGVAAIQAAEGTLTDAEISGTDVSAAITQAEIQRARAVDDQKRIDAELAKKKLSAGERVDLQQRRADANKSIVAAADDASAQRESLANTPMEFDYTSGAAIRGFDASAPIKSSVDTLFGSAQTTFAVVLGAIALLGPPALVLLLGWCGFRAIRRRWTHAARITPPATD